MYVIEFALLSVDRADNNYGEVQPTSEPKRSCASKAGVQPEVPFLDLRLQVCNEIRIGMEHLQDRQNHAWAVRAIGEDDHP